MDTLPSQVQGGSEFSVRADEACSLRGEDGTCTTVDGYQAHPVRMTRAESQGVRCTAAVGNDGNNIEFQGIEKLDEIVRDFAQSMSREAGGMTEARSVNHDHSSPSGQRVRTSGDARRSSALESHHRPVVRISPDAPGQRPVVAQLETTVKIGNALLVYFRGTDCDHS